MSFETMLSALNISASGMSAERLRMEVVANNVANAFSTRTPAGGPFRRKDVVFATVLKDQARASPPAARCRPAVCWGESRWTASWTIYRLSRSSTTPGIPMPMPSAMCCFPTSSCPSKW